MLYEINQKLERKKKHYAELELLGIKTAIDPLIRTMSIATPKTRNNNNGFVQSYIKSQNEIKMGSNHMQAIL
jgi:hypothetical protein